jgi:molybdopterin-guanine dinucleotide biosynthesis protein A
VLVGGVGSRFGGDKPSAKFRGQSLLNNALAVLDEAGLCNLAYVGGPPRNDVSHDVEYIPDCPDLAEVKLPQCALRGVVSVLQSLRPQHSQALIMACDVPLVRASTLRSLLESLDDNDAAVPHGKRDHWSCIAVRQSTLAHLLAAFRRGQYAMHHAFGSLRLARLDVEEHEFTNVNSRADLDAVITDAMTDRG